MTRRAQQGYIVDALLLTGTGFDRYKVLFFFVLSAGRGGKLRYPV